MSDQELKARLGDHASRILNDPAVRASLERMRAKAYKDFESCEWWNTRKMKECRRMLKTIAAFEDELGQTVRNGQKAKSRIDQPTA